MGGALLPPFLGSTILFSLTPNYEERLKEELWLCHKHMSLSMDDLLQMTVYDRRNYILIHNKEVEKENLKLQNQLKKK